MKKLIVATLIGTSSLTVTAAPGKLMSQLARTDRIEAASFTKMSQAGKQAYDIMVARFEKAIVKMSHGPNGYAFVEASADGRGGVLYIVNTLNTGEVVQRAFSIPKSEMTPKSMNLYTDTRGQYHVQRHFETPTGKYQSGDTYEIDFPHTAKQNGVRQFSDYELQTPVGKLVVLKEEPNGLGDALTIRFFTPEGVIRLDSRYVIPAVDGKVVGASATGSVDRIKIFVEKDNKIEELIFEVKMHANSENSISPRAIRVLSRNEAKEFGLTVETKYFSRKGGVSNKSAASAIVRDGEATNTKAVQQAQ